MHKIKNMVLLGIVGLSLESCCGRPKMRNSLRHFNLLFQPSPPCPSSEHVADSRTSHNPSGDVDPLRLRRVEISSSVKVGVSSEWFQACGTGFFDKSELSQVCMLGQSRRFPPWRQRTGSAVLGVF